MSVAAAQPSPNQRLHGLDWLRAGATILVVALHAGIGYLVARFPGLAWSTHDPVGSLAVDALTWWIDGFVMPLFFVLGGFVAWGLMQRKGPSVFLVQRTSRLLCPFAIGSLFILPLSLYVWLLGWIADGKLPISYLESPRIRTLSAHGMWGSAHLWFLQYLWLYCVLAGVVMWVRERTRKDYLACEQGDPADSSSGGRRPQLYSVLRTRYADDLIIGLLGVSVFALWWEPQLVIGFRHRWWPLPANFLFYAPWFAIGWLMASRQPRRKIPRGEWRLVASFAVFAALWPMIHQHVASAFVGQARLVLATVFVLHAWLAVSGWFGICLRRLDHEPPRAVTYFAAASFWVYLLHHPVVGLTQVTLRALAIPVAAKFAITLLAGVSLPLLTYEVFVRRTWVGVVLNGHRDARTAPKSTEATMPLPQPVAEPRRTAA